MHFFGDRSKLASRFNGAQKLRGARSHLLAGSRHASKSARSAPELHIGGTVGETARFRVHNELGKRNQGLRVDWLPHKSQSDLHVGIPGEWRPEI